MDDVSAMLALQKIHGHVALLALAACLHAPIALRHVRRPSWATRMSAYSASFLTIAANVIGWIVYPAYREEVKPNLYRVGQRWGELFEIKEHLAFYSLVLAIAGAVMVFGSADERGIVLRQPIRLVYLIIAGLILAAAVMGVLVSSVYGFPHGAALSR